MSTPIVVVEGIEKHFGVVRALNGVSLDVRGGEVLALVGENGAGKSTLMRILEGVYTPDAGRVLVDGQAIHFHGPKDALTAGIRVIHQEPEIIPELSVAENIFLGDFKPSAGLFLDWRDLEARARRVLDDFGVGAELKARRRCTRLGPAQRQLLEIMRALHAGGRVVAFDEPTSSLTEEEARRLFAIIGRLRAEGVAVVYISHRLPEVMALADRIAVLRDGALVAVRPAGQLTEGDVVRLMVGRDLKSLFQRSGRAVGEAVLEVRGLTTDAVADCSLTVHKGEVVGLGGLVGAGRSELARAIFGFDRRRAGTVSVAGKPVRPDSPADAILAGIGFAPEDRKQEALLLARSVLDNIVLCVPDRVGRYGFLDRGRAAGIASTLAERLRIRTPSLDQQVSKLSGGNQQKAVLGRWLAREPRLLILDEPTRGIDVGTKAELYRLIDELAAAGMAILLISSEMPELLGLADRILVMSGRRIAGALAREEASEEAILALAMRHHTASAA
jgi:L-arabinose transport system ATP-binding protein